MKNNFLEKNFEYILDEIYSYQGDPHDTEYFVSVYFDEDENPHILIDDVWSLAYTIQIYDFRVEDIKDLSKDELREMLQINLDRTTKSVAHKLEILITKTKDFVKNNINDLIEDVNIYHQHNDTYYLTLGCINDRLYYHFDTVTENAYLYEIYDTEEDADRDDLIRFRLMNSMNAQISRWKIALEYLK
jgi:hypothetical protein